MRSVLILLALIISHTLVAQCDNRSRSDGLLFVINDYDHPNFQFIVSGKTQLAFINKDLGVYKYLFSMKTFIDEKDISLIDKKFMKITSVQAQDIDGKCFKVVSVQRFRGLKISTNIAYPISVNKTTVKTPAILPVANNDSRTIVSNLEGWNYTFILEINKLLHSQHQQIEHDEKKIKEIILKINEVNSQEASFLKKKIFQVKNITYQLTQ